MIQFGLFGVLFGVASFEPGYFHREQNELLSSIGIKIVFGSLILLVFTAINFGQFITPNPVPRDNSKLRTTGFYAIVRHPMYFLILLFFLGYIVHKQAYFSIILFVMLFLFFNYKTNIEEKFLCDKFPEYDSYRKETKKLIPYIY